MNQKYILSANNNSLIEEIHNTVQSIGYCIVRGLNLNHLDDSRRNKKLFDFLSQLGMLTNHKDDGFKSIFLDIKYRGDDYVINNDITFSEDVGECPLHSDSSFSENPESYLVMYVVKSANDGGNSLFLSSSDIVNQLSKTETGKKHLKTLTGNLYPFKAPASFDKKQGVRWGNILSVNTQMIRFRSDCIYKGIEENRNKVSKEMVLALDYLVKIIKNASDIQEFSAQDDGLIIIDNVNGLHAGTDYTDKNRHYIRARITV
ncbi:TPA: TauD/TfdA family dioxygenase [Neisseria meningitidis]